MTTKQGEWQSQRVCCREPLIEKREIDCAGWVGPGSNYRAGSQDNQQPLSLEADRLVGVSVYLGLSVRSDGSGLSVVLGFQSHLYFSGGGRAGVTLGLHCHRLTRGHPLGTPVKDYLERSVWVPLLLGVGPWAV